MSKIYKREGKNKTTWQIYFYTPEGKLKGKTFDRKKQAEEYLAKVKVAKKENRYHDVFNVKKESQTTFDELLGVYVENFKPQKSYPTKVFVIRELREAFGDRKLGKITYLDMETYRNRRKATPLKSGKLRAEASVNYEMAVFAHILSKAVEWGLLETSPFKKGKRLMFKVDNGRTRFLTEDEIEALLKECPRHLKPIVETALHTGMRRGEVLSLKWEQINHGFIYLEGGMVKSGKGRQIPINDRLAEVLKELRRANELKSDFVFCDSQGRRFQDVRSSFAGACRRAGIRDFTFHDLRHTFASHLVMNGVGLKAVQELLGHADLTMTMRYAHLSKGHLREAVAVLDNLGGIKKILINPPENKKEVNALSLTP
ncbi:MAG: site-specific integrase [Desulfobaccales bacterium]|nr:site-specific integrase [Desulfobaccales bacterium]